MTHFEFISVGVSIVLALSAARLLAALPHVLAPGRRYWIHAMWSLALLFAHMDFWWTIWIYREIDPWTFTGFAVVMLTPALLFLTVSSLVSDSPMTIASWRTHFYAKHRVFFSLYFATVCSIPLRQLDRTRRRLHAPRRGVTRVASSTTDDRWSGDPCTWHHHNE
jgi:hypothetical protein